MELKQFNDLIIVPEYSPVNRLCNYHFPEPGYTGETALVPADEWERFNAMAGRQHKIVDGAVVYDASLEPCLPDDANTPDEMTLLQHRIDHLQDELLTGYMAQAELYELTLRLEDQNLVAFMAIAELYETALSGEPL